jgi:hypothetical protein
LVDGAAPRLARELPAMTTNLCPACGPVGGDLSSRYCMHHLKELLLRCLEMPAASRPSRRESTTWREPVARTRRAA